MTGAAATPMFKPRVETRLVYAHGLAAIAVLLISLLFGFLASLQLIAPDSFGGAAWLSWGRLRYDHTQGIMLGWLGNAFFAFLYHAVPMLTGRPVTSGGWGIGCSAYGTSPSFCRAGFWCWAGSASRSNGLSFPW